MMDFLATTTAPVRGMCIDLDREACLKLSAESKDPRLSCLHDNIVRMARRRRPLSAPAHVVYLDLRFSALDDDDITEVLSWSRNSLAPEGLGRAHHVHAAGA